MTVLFLSLFIKFMNVYAIQNYKRINKITIYSAYMQKILGTIYICFCKKGEEILKNYNSKKKRNHTLLFLVGEAIFIFVVATSSIVLYDMYINIDVVEYEPYSTEKISKEVNAENTNDVSDILENVSRSVVRNI